MNTLFRSVSSFALGATLIAGSAVGCGSDPAAAKDATVACSDLCKASGFTDSRADNQPNELNCFCTGGAGTVAATACSEMCTSIGKAKGAPFKSAAGANANACQCE